MPLQKLHGDPLENIFELGRIQGLKDADRQWLAWIEEEREKAGGSVDYFIHRLRARAQGGQSED